MLVVAMSVKQLSSEHMNTTNLRNRIKPGRDYYLNVAKLNEAWEEAEFCPVLIEENGASQQMDGMYGLYNDIYVHLNPRPIPEDDEKVGNELAVYEGAMHEALSRGETEGVATGVIGPRRWRLVHYDDSAHKQWNPNAVVSCNP